MFTQNSGYESISDQSTNTVFDKHHYIKSSVCISERVNTLHTFEE